MKAFKEFTDQHPEAEFELVGRGPEKQQRGALVRRLHAGSKVRFLSARPRDELLRKMVTSDVVLFPSLRDRDGALAIEAMAVGKPAISMDVGRPGTLVTGNCAVKVTPSSPEGAIHELANALERFNLTRNCAPRWVR
jgi:glycosyltransferase involved in cell wall biosynthesis